MGASGVTGLTSSGHLLALPLRHDAVKRPRHDGLLVDDMQAAVAQQRSHLPLGAYEGVKTIAIGKQQARAHGADPAQKAAMLRVFIKYEIKPQPTCERLRHGI